MAVTKTFLLAGDATFTIDGPDKHRTFRVRLKPSNGTYGPVYFVYTLYGPDNTSDFVYLGVLDAASGIVRLTAKSKLRPDSFRFRLLNRVLARVWKDDHAAYEAHGYKTHHEGKCGRCGRSLTVPSSIESGIGPECAKHLGLAS